MDNSQGNKALLRILNDICGYEGFKAMPGVQVRAPHARLLTAAGVSI